MLILLIIDGLRADAVTEQHMPILWSLKDRGIWSLAAQAQFPSISMPCHMSIFHSVPVTRHGLTDNNWSPMARPVDGIVEQLVRHGKKYGALYGWEGFRNLWQPLQAEFDLFRRCKSYPETNDDFLLDEALGWINAEAPDFLFLHFDTADGAGHKYGWMSKGYLNQVTHIDSLIGDLTEALPDVTLMILSDHGGRERDHGGDTPEEMTVPWILVGPGVPADGEIAGPVTLLDCAPTIAGWFGIDGHEDWEGKNRLANYE